MNKSWRRRRSVRYAALLLGITVVALLVDALRGWLSEPGRRPSLEGAPTESPPLAAVDAATMARDAEGMQAARGLRGIVVHALAAESAEPLAVAWYLLVGSAPGSALDLPVERTVVAHADFAGSVEIARERAGADLVVGAPGREVVRAGVLGHETGDCVDVPLQQLGSLRIRATCGSLPVHGLRGLLVPPTSTHHHWFRLQELGGIPGAPASLPGFEQIYGQFEGGSSHDATRALTGDGNDLGTALLALEALLPELRANPADDLRVLIDRLGRERHAATDGDTLVFAGLPPAGDYCLAVRAARSAGCSDGVRTEVAIRPGEESLVEFDLAEAWRLFGTVTIDGAPAANVRVHLWQVGAGLLGFLLTDPVGAYEFLPPRGVREFELKVEGSGASRIPVARLLRRHHPPEALEEQIDFALRTDQFIVRGRVVRKADGSPAPGVEIDLGSKGPTVVCNDQGEFAAAGLADEDFPLEARVLHREDNRPKVSVFTLSREEADAYVVLTIE